MRKIFVFACGLLVLSGAFVFQSDAQYFCDGKVDQKYRYRSQGCCTDMKRTSRNFSNRIGPFRYRRNNSKCNYCRYGNRHASRRDDVTKYSQYRQSQLSYRQRIKLKREREFMHYPRYENTIESPVNVVRNGDYRVKNDLFSQDNVVKTSTSRLASSNLFSNQFAVEIPDGFYRDRDGIYRSDNDTLAFRVVSAGKCNSLGFVSCVRGVSNKFKSEQNISTTQNYKKSFRWNQTMHTDFTYYPSITESFDAVIFGKTYSYFIYNAINPVDGSIIRIEVVTNANEKYDTVHSAFELFETFRFKI